MHLEPYLSFDGTCEEALAFYAVVFRGEVTSLMRFAGSPMADAVPPEAQQRIMHASFKSPTLQFMASDGNRATECVGNRVALSISTPDLPEAQRVFTALCDGGTIVMPYGKVFWGAMFGICTDKFGIDWMVSGEAPA
ncbi:MAG: VOC family protein [Vulcanimicrobiaceae bacterium]